METRDFERFTMLLYVGNSTTSIHLSNLAKHQGPALIDVLNQERGEQFVDIGAYCIMPNHLHLALREKKTGGISAFMQKIGTGYTMYFNKKYNRTGALFSGRFKARHVATDAYFNRLINYIHANPAELFEPNWKQGLIKDEKSTAAKLLQYPYSSLPDFENKARIQNKIVNIDATLSITDRKPSLSTVFEDALTFNSHEESFEE